jgi:hypothetical protein
MKNVHEWLNEKGYNGPRKDQFKDYAVYFHKRIENTNHLCLVYEHKIPIPNSDCIYRSYTVEICFETQDEVWVKNQFYAVSEEVLMSKLEELEKRLYASVVPMGGNAKNYRSESDD